MLSNLHVPVPLDAISVELCRRITRATPALNKVDSATAPFVLPRLGIAPPGAGNGNSERPPALVRNGKTNGGVARNVMRHAAQQAGALRKEENDQLV